MKKPQAADQDAAWGFSLRFRLLFYFTVKLRVIQITLRHADDHVDIVGAADGIGQLHNILGQIFQVVAWLAWSFRATICLQDSKSCTVAKSNRIDSFMSFPTLLLQS